MKGKRKVVKDWRPAYPESKDARVQLQSCDFQTFISDRRPGINVTDHPVEAPACFWIDHEHVYLRVNWSMWSSISLDSPEQVVAICNAHYCRVIYSTGNVIGESSAPVYRIAELPRELFNNNSNDGDSEDDFADSHKDKSEFQQCVDRIRKIVKGKEGVSVFPRCTLGDDCAPVVISNDEHAIIMDVLPDERNFIFCSPEGKKRHQRIENWSTHIVSLDFIEQLRNLKKTLAELEPEAIIDIGFLANGNTLSALHSYFDMDADDISDLKLFSYESLGEKLEFLFSDQQAQEEEIAKRVKEIIVEHLGVDASKVQDDAVLVDDLGADELDFLELSIAFIGAFGCALPDNALDAIHTVKDAIDFIEKHHN